MVLFVFLQKVLDSLDLVDEELAQRVRLGFLENELLGLGAHGFDKEVKSENHALDDFKVSLPLRMLKL